MEFNGKEILKWAAFPVIIVILQSIQTGVLIHYNDKAAARVAEAQREFEQKKLSLEALKLHTERLINGNFDEVRFALVSIKNIDPDMYLAAQELVANCNGRIKEVDIPHVDSKLLMRFSIK